MRIGLRSILLQLLIALTAMSSYPQVSNDVYLRTFLLKTPVGTGTTFTIDVEGRQYLVTAKHMVAGLGDHHLISVFRDKAWKPLDVAIFRCNDPIDIAVLIPNEILSHTDTLPLSPGTKIYFGQELFFVGFPFGWSMEFPALSPDPIAIVKRGVFSATIEQGGVKVMLIDGYNNFGFSGGPVVYHLLGEAGYDLSVTAVISGFQPELRPVVKEVPLKPGERVAGMEAWRLTKDKNGRPIKLVDTGNYVPVNTGFLTAFDIAYALESIHEHPLGPKIAP